MEESRQQGFDNPSPGIEDSTAEPSYWLSVSTAGLIFGIVAFILSLVSNYAIINSEPTGSLFSPTQFLGAFACLAASFGGMLAVWHYARQHEVFIQLGRGALIGFLTGICVTVVTIVLGEAWQFVDPDMTEQMIESTIANIEAIDMPEAQKQQIIDATAEGFQSQSSIFSQLLWGIPIYGILNLITGMIGAKIFGQQEA